MSMLRQKFNNRLHQKSFNQQTYIYAILFLVMVIVVGCQKDIPVTCENITINNTIFIYNTTNTIIEKEKIIYINNSENKSCPRAYSDTYTVDLIRRLKYCEDALVTQWNLSECTDEWRQCNMTNDILNKTLAEIRGLI